MDPGIDPAPMAASRNLFGGRGVYADSEGAPGRGASPRRISGHALRRHRGRSRLEWDELPLPVLR